MDREMPPGFPGAEIEPDSMEGRLRGGSTGLLFPTGSTPPPLTQPLTQSGQPVGNGGVTGRQPVPAGVRLARMAGVVEDGQTNHEAMHAALQQAVDAHEVRLNAENQSNINRDRAVQALQAQVAALDARPVTNRSEFYARLSSRKFLLAVATALGAILAAVAGALPPEWAAVIAAVAGGLFTIAEGIADAQTRGAAPAKNGVSVKQT